MCVSFQLTEMLCWGRRVERSVGDKGEGADGGRVYQRLGLLTLQYPHEAERERGF